MPKWLEKAVFYEIYPQSFYDSNGDGIGDLPGIIQKLDYIKELGCNAIWLNPCFDSPFYDAGYDIRDYYKVAPRYGTNQDMADLFREVHERGMHIILDLVPGHTSIQHPWFQVSMSSMKNEYTERYIWTPYRKVKPKFDQPGENYSNIRGFIIGFGGRPGCCAVNFYSTQPALNYGFWQVEDPSWQLPMDAPGPMATREALKDIMRFWLQLGCDGFRVDMAGEVIKNDPTQEGNVKLWQYFREFLDEEFPQAAMISEWGYPMYSIRGGFHMDFLLKRGKQHYWELFRSEKPYFSRRGEGDILQFVENFQKDYEETNGKGLICIPSGNHDISRITEELDIEEIKIAFAFILSMPGAPFLYYGDEIGMKNMPGLDSVEGSEERTQCRTPMQWNKGVNAGFSMAGPDKLYAPMDPDKNRPNVEEEMNRENSLWKEIQQLIKIRQAHPALEAAAGIRFVYAKRDSYPFVYLRECQEERILVVINPKDEQTLCKCTEEFGRMEVLYSNHGEATFGEDGTLTVPAASATFFRIVDENS
ncbi:MAG: glycosylase [Lachnospiraceae bacterium]|nr:glycosylase [Lachnospiraceae bacterium]